MCSIIVQDKILVSFVKLNIALILAQKGNEIMNIMASVNTNHFILF